MQMFSLELERFLAPLGKGVSGGIVWATPLVPLSGAELSISKHKVLPHHTCWVHWLGHSVLLLFG